MKKIIFAISMMCFSVHAKPMYFSEIQARLPEAKLDFKCATCHSKNSLQLNLFGKDFAKAKHQFAPTDSLWFENLMQLDSDLDSVSNYDELMQGRAPGVKN